MNTFRLEQGRSIGVIESVTATMVVAFVVAAFLVLAGNAHSAPRWSDGVIANDVQNINCQSLIFNPPGYLENEIAVYTGQYIDDDPARLSPVPGEVFDVHVVVGTVGNNCASTAPQIEIALPPGVRPAVTPATPIHCYFSPDFTNWTEITRAQGCPASAGPGVTSHPSISTWYELNPEPPYPSALWPIAQGSAMEIQVPVVSDRTLEGIGDSSGCVCVVASVTTTNGQSRPDDFFTWSSSFPSTGAYQHLFVFPPKRKLAVKLRVPGQSLSKIARRGSISARCTTTKPASCRTRASISRSDARRIGLRVSGKAGRVTIGTSRRIATMADRAVSVPMRLTSRARAALRRSGRALKIVVTADASAGGGGSASTRTSLVARP